jgi:hypothetical protein
MQKKTKIYRGIDLRNMVSMIWGCTRADGEKIPSGHI